MLKTLWVEPGEGATVGELVGAMGGLPPGFAAGGVRTSLAIVGEGKVIFDAYDRIRAIEALERVGVRLSGEVEVAVVGKQIAGLQDVPPTGYRQREVEEMAAQAPGRWPDLAEKLLTAAQAVVNDAELANYGGGDSDVYVVDVDIMRSLMAAVQAVHNEAVAVIERERSRNR